jgi:hypothetical protein
MSAGSDADSGMRPIDAPGPLRTIGTMRSFTGRAPAHWHINLQEPWEIRFWSRELDCSEEALRAAVDAVGNRAFAVRGFLDQAQRRLPGLRAQDSSAR